MTLNIDAFSAFYREVYGYEPFRWQVRAVERIVASGRWPDVIDAPTGAGKSSVVDIHVFANALVAMGAAERVPRRLAVVVNRRALVDSQLGRAEGLATRLEGATDGVLAEVAEALRSLGGSGVPLRVVSLRGGQPTDRTWVDDPVTPMIIAATPDMWGSRLLFRGYGTSRLARPREAGLLAADCVAVVDEAHLSQQLMHTAIEVAALVARRADAIRPVPPLQVVSATATQAIAGSETEGVREADLQVDRALEVRLRTFKELRIVRESVKASPAKRAAFIAEQAVALSQAVAEQQKPTVLVIVNRRATAAAVTDLLVKEVGWEAVVCWAGRMRPMDVDALREERPGLLSIDGNPQTKFLVATQTAEVGVDLDCAALVTELAPGTSLTQRFGRVDRLGERRAAQIAVVVPGALVADQPPYRAGDLSAALDWLEEIGNGGDVSPWRLRETPPPQESLRRRALSDVWPSDAELLARTTGDLFEEPDLAFWLRDDLEDDESPVGVVIRRLPFADEGALALLRQVPLVAAEAFPASIGTARRVIARALGAARSLDLGHEPRAFRFREDDFALIDGNEDQLRPGDVVIVDQDVPVTWHNMLMPDLPGAAARPAPRVYSGSDDVRVFWPGDRLAGFDPCVVFAGPIEAAQEFYDQLLSDGRVKEPRQVRTVPDLVDDEGNLPWVVLVPPEVVREDEELRQEWSASGPVLLAVHQDAVAARAVEYAERLGLPPTLVDALRDAGLHHDDGKQEVEFQRMLRDRSDQQQITAVNGVLAKSIGRSSQRVKRLAATRQGWRHEQLSVAFTQLALGMDEHGFLAARLVGTSHGHGRPFFPHGPDSLLQSEGIAQPVRDAAQALYQAGAGWSDLLSQTDGRFGVWGIAYLEAVLRAADGTVSGEGS